MSGEGEDDTARLGVFFFRGGGLAVSSFKSISVTDTFFDVEAVVVVDVDAFARRDLVNRSSAPLEESASVRVLSSSSTLAKGDDNSGSVMTADVVTEVLDVNSICLLSTGEGDFKL